MAQARTNAIFIDDTPKMESGSCIQDSVPKWVLVPDTQDQGPHELVVNDDDVYSVPETLLTPAAYSGQRLVSSTTLLLLDYCCYYMYYYYYYDTNYLP